MLINLDIKFSEHLILHFIRRQARPNGQEYGRYQSHFHKQCTSLILLFFESRAQRFASSKLGAGRHSGYANFYYFPESEWANRLTAAEDLALEVHFTNKMIPATSSTG